MTSSAIFDALLAISLTFASMQNIASTPLSHIYQPSIHLLGNESCREENHTLNGMCNVSLKVCKTEGGSYIGHAVEASLNVTTRPLANYTEAATTAIYELLNKMDMTETNTDCSCKVLIVPQGTGCVMQTGGCFYYQHPSKVYTPDILYKGRAFDLNSTHNLTGTSQGSTNYSYSLIAAVKNLKEKIPNEFNKSCGKPTPMVVFPGFSGSGIQYKLRNAAKIPGLFWCPNGTKDWEVLYPFPSNQSAFMLECDFHNLGLRFDSNTQPPSFPSKRPGVLYRTPPVGDIAGMAHGFSDFASDVLEPMGWEVGKNLFPAPYDWRIPAAGQESFFASVKTLVETAYSNNNSSRVVLLSTSLGPQITCLSYTE